MTIDFPLQVLTGSNLTEMSREVGQLVLDSQAPSSSGCGAGRPGSSVLGLHPSDRFTLDRRAAFAVLDCPRPFETKVGGKTHERSFAACIGSVGAPDMLWVNAILGVEGVGWLPSARLP